MKINISADSLYKHINFQNIPERVYKQGLSLLFGRFGNLDKIKKNLPLIKSRYGNLYCDIDVILGCVDCNLSYDAIEFLLSRHEEAFEEYGENAMPLRYLLLNKKYEIFELFLRYGFDINGTVKSEGKSIRENFDLFLSLISSDDPYDGEDIKFLISHGLNINRFHQDLAAKATYLNKKKENFRTIDVLIERSLNGKKNKLDEKSMFYDCLKFLFEHYKTVNVKPIISLIFLGKDRKKISKNDLKKELNKYIRFISFEEMPERIYFKLASYENAFDILKMYISYVGEDFFFKSKCFKKFEKLKHKSRFYQSLLEQKLDPIYNLYKKKQENIVDKNLIFQKIKEKKFNKVNEILQEQKDAINYRNNEEKSPLIYAAQYCSNNVEIIDLLIKYNSNIDDIDCNGSTPLHIACQYNNYKIIPKLITQNNINLPSKDNLTPLMIALKNRNYDCIMPLLSSEYYIDINKLNNENDNNNNNNEDNDNTLIEYLLEKNVENKELFELLISKGGYIQYDKFKNELLSKIIYNKSFIKVMTNQGFHLLIDDNTNYINTPLIFSINENMTDLAKLLLENYEFVNEKGDNDKPCLIYAIENPNEEYFDLLIKSNKINIEDSDSTGKNALTCSLGLKKDRMVKELLYGYINIYETDTNEITKLKKEVDDEFTRIKTKLSKQDTLDYPKVKNAIISVMKEIEQEKEEIKEKLRKEKEKEKEKIIEKLKEQENKINNDNVKNDEITEKRNNNEFNEYYPPLNTNIDEYTVLSTACTIGEKAILESLINTKIFDINKTIGNQKLTPLMTLILNEKYDCVDLLLDNNADVNIRDLYGNSPFIYMLKYSKINENIYKLLIKNGAVIDYGLFKNGAFINKIIKNEVFLKLFIDKKIKINYENADKEVRIKTPLIFTLKLNNSKLFEILLSHNIGIEEQDEMGNDPLTVANNVKNKQIIRSLKKYIKSYKKKNKNRNVNNNTNGDDIDDTGNNESSNSDITKDNISNSKINAINNGNNKNIINNSKINNDIVTKNEKINNEVILVNSKNKNRIEINGNSDYNKNNVIINKINSNTITLVSNNNKNTKNIGNIKENNINDDLKISTKDRNEEETNINLLSNNVYNNVYNIDFTGKDDSNSIYQYPSLHIACFNNNPESTEILNLLLDSEECDINEQAREYKFTPLMLLIYIENYTKAKILLEKNPDVNIRDKNNNTPFIFMLKYSKINEEIYKLLISHGAYVDYELFSNSYFIEKIINNPVFIKMLINKEIKIKYENSISLIATPLIFSINTKQYHLVETLLKNKINTDEKDENNNDPLSVANKTNNSKIIDLISRHIKYENKNKIREVAESTLKNDKVESNIEDNREKPESNVENEIVESGKKIIDSNIKNEKNSFNNNNNINNNIGNNINNNIGNNIGNIIDNNIINNIGNNINNNIGNNIGNDIGNNIDNNIINNIGNNINNNNGNKIANNNSDSEKIINEEYNINRYKILNENYTSLQLLCIEGNENKMEKNLSNDSNIINKINEKFGDYQFTPLMALIFNSYYDCAKLLLKYNPDVNIKDIYENTPLIYMLKNLKVNKEIYELLFNHGAYINKKLFDENSFIEQIIKNKPFIELLINKSVKICDSNNNLKTIRQPLIFAIKRNNNEFAKILIENGADVNEISYNGNTPLLQAIDNNNFDIVKLLINNNVNLNQLNNEGKHPLDIAKEMCDKEIVSYIQDKLKYNINNNYYYNNNKINVNDTGYNNYDNSININNYNDNNINLYNNDDNNNNINQYNNDNNLSRSLNNSSENLSFESQKYQNYQNYRYDDIYNNLYNNEEIYDKSAIINDIKMDKENNSLHTLCLIENNERRSYLIKLNLEKYLMYINKQIGSYKITPLMLLIIFKYYNDVPYLIEKGADVNIRDCYGNTPFIYLLKNKIINKELYELFINHNAFIDDNLFNDPNFIECISKNKLFINLLINGKIKVYDINWNVLPMEDPLLFAIENNDILLAKLLIRNNVDIEKPDSKGNTPIFNAITCGDVEIIELLLNHFVDLTKLNHQGKNVFEHALMNDPDIYNNLVIKSKMLNNASHRNDQLFLAIKTNSIKNAISAIENGANINYENKNGLTPLLYAIYKNNLKMVDLLISHGVNVNSPNKNGISPLKYAIKKKNKDIIKTLLYQSGYLGNDYECNKFIIDTINNEEFLAFDYIINNPKKDIHELKVIINNLNRKPEISNYSFFKMNKIKHKNLMNDYHKVKHENLVKKVNNRNNELKNDLNSLENINNRSISNGNYSDTDSNQSNLNINEHVYDDKSNNSISDIMNSKENKLYNDIFNDDDDDDDVFDDDIYNYSIDDNNSINGKYSNQEEEDDDDDDDEKEEEKEKEGKESLFSLIDQKNFHDAKKRIRNKNYSNINEENENGDNLLTYLILNPDCFSKDFFGFLVNHGAYVNKNIFENHKNNSLYTKKFINTLLKKKLKIRLNPKEEPKLITQPLRFLINNRKYGYMSSILQKIKKSSDKDYVNDDPSLLIDIINKGNHKALNVLLKFTDPNIKYENGKTLLMYAAECNETNNIQVLINNNININEQDINGETALFYAVSKKQKDNIKLLVESGADVEIKNNRKENILFTAVKTNKFSIVYYLIPKVKDKKCRNIENHTIYYYAKKNNIINLLDKNGITE